MQRIAINCSFLVCAWILFILLVTVSTRAENATSYENAALVRDDWSSLRTNSQVYDAACASCHGSDGKGTDQSTVGFEIPLPDFTDCSFASREPHADWFAVAHNGGPTRGFDPMMPAFGGAISDQQIEMAASHVKSFCQDRSWPPGEFNLPRPLITGKAYLEDEYVLEMQSTVEEPVAVQAKFVAEWRLWSRAQVELAVPVGVQQIETVEPDGSTDRRWGEGFGDVAVGLKGVLWHSLDMGSIGSLGFETFFPLGDEEDDLSEGIFRFEPFVAIGQIIPGDNFIQLHAGAELSTDTSLASHELFWRGAFGHTFTQGRFGRSWSPMLEVLGAYELDSDSSPEWSLVPELHVSLNQRQHIMVNIGVEIPITEFDERQITVAASLMWDWFDGGFTEGW